MIKKTNETITETTNEKRMMNKKTVGIVAGATVTVAAVIYHCFASQPARVKI